MRHPRILNRAAQANESEGFEEGAIPVGTHDRRADETRALHQEPAETASTYWSRSVNWFAALPVPKILPPPGAPD